MSLEDLCDQDSVTVYRMTPTSGAAFGTSYTRGTGAATKCCVQEMDGSEILDYKARGKKVSHQLLFSSDPGIGPEHEIEWNGETLQFRGAYKEGRPGESMLWIVVCDLVSTRDR
jgi:hypothetical protein